MQFLTKTNKDIVLKYVLAIIFLSTAMFVNGASDHLGVAKDAIQKLDAINSEYWSYKHTRSTDGEVTSSYFDPRRSLNQQWQLLLINGQVPTREAIDEFNALWNVEEELEESGIEEEGSLSQMIAINSLMLDRIEKEAAYFTFTPILEDMAEEITKLRGTIVVNLDNKVVQSLSINNIEPISPAFSITLDRFNMGFEFETIDQKLVYRKIEMKMEGTAGFVKEISQQSIEEFSEYYYVGPPA